MDDKLTIGWRWQDFGSGPMLVTDGRGAQVVLTTPSTTRGNAFWTRDNETGRLRKLDPEVDRDVMATIAGASEMRRLLIAIRDGKEVKDPLENGSTVIVDIDDASERAEKLLAKLGL